MVVAFFYCIFVFVIVYVRLDFSISRDEAAESKLKVASYVENAQSVLDRRSALYQAYDDAVNKYKVSHTAFILDMLLSGNVIWLGQKCKIFKHHKTLKYVILWYYAMEITK